MECICAWTAKIQFKNIVITLKKKSGVGYSSFPVLQRERVCWLACQRWSSPSSPSPARCLRTVEGKGVSHCPRSPAWDSTAFAPWRNSPDQVLRSRDCRRSCSVSHQVRHGRGRWAASAVLSHNVKTQCSLATGPPFLVWFAFREAQPLILSSLIVFSPHNWGLHSRNGMCLSLRLPPHHATSWSWNPLPFPVVIVVFFFSPAFNRGSSFRCRCLQHRCVSQEVHVWESWGCHSIPVWPRTSCSASPNLGFLIVYEIMNNAYLARLLKKCWWSLSGFLCA